MRLDVHHHHKLDPELARFLDWAFKALIQKQGLIMATQQEIKDVLAELTEGVADLKNSGDSIIQFLDNQTAKLDELINAPSGIDVEGLKALVATVKTESQAIKDDILKNTRQPPTV